VAPCELLLLAAVANAVNAIVLTRSKHSLGIMVAAQYLNVRSVLVVKEISSQAGPAAKAFTDDRIELRDDPSRSVPYTQCQSRERRQAMKTSR
jgi:hypothetical protein